MATTKNNRSTDRISNTVITNLIAYTPNYLIEFELKQPDPEDPELDITSQHKKITIYINANDTDDTDDTDDINDCLIEFELEQSDSEDLELEITFNADDITFKVYFD